MGRAAVLIAATLFASPVLATEARASEPAVITADDVRPIFQTSNDPFTVLMQLREARYALDAGDAEAAAKGFAVALSADPGLREAAMGLGEARLRLRDWHGAEAAFAPFADRFGPARTGLFLAQARTGRLPAPEFALPSHYDVNPDPRLMFALGRYLDDRSRGVEARKAYARARPDAEPGAVDTHVGLSLLREGRVADASRAFRRAHAHAPNVAAYDRNRRLCAVMLGDYQAGLDGVSADDAALLLREAGAQALANGEAKLARLFLMRAQALAPRHDPRTEALLAQLDAGLRELDQPVDRG